MSAPRLSAAELTPIRSNEKDVKANRIVHFGFGQFVRAHMAWYTQRAVDTSGDNWRITAVNLNSSKTKEILREQDFLYSVFAQSKDDQQLDVINVLDEALSPATGDVEALRSVLLSPQTKIVSLTVTEKGYYQLPNGKLDLDHEDIQHDVNNESQPRTVLGWILLGLAERRKLGIEPFTPLALDNLNSNGLVLKNGIRQLAKLKDQGLASSIEEQVLFPCSMVDRIVPASGEQQIIEVERALGLRDDAAAVTEVFSQWALEDKFVGPRPDWHLVGVQLCNDVELFEAMKLRLLNGAHSALAYIGLLLGHHTVSDCMSDNLLQSLIRRLMTDEIKHEVPAPDGVDLEQYIDSLIARFSNPHLNHQLRQIAMDGSQKIPQRWVPVLLQRVASQATINLLTFCLAAWIRYLRTLTIEADPIADQLQRCRDMAADDAVIHVLTKLDVFPQEFQQESVVAEVTEHLLSMETEDIRSVIERLLG